MRHAITGILTIVAIIAVTPILSSSLGCSGSSRSTSLEEEFLSVEEGEMSSFVLSGSAKCETCGDLDTSSLYVELVARVNPTSYLSVGTFNGLGSFTFQNLRAVAGSTVDVYGMLFLEGKPDSQALQAQTTFEVPEEDSEAVAVILRFNP